MTPAEELITPFGFAALPRRAEDPVTRLRELRMIEDVVGFCPELHMEGF